MEDSKNGISYMSKGEFESELMYCMSLSVAKSMLKKGLVTEVEYRQIDTILIKKHRPLLGTLLSENPLT